MRTTTAIRRQSCTCWKAPPGTGGATACSTSSRRVRETSFSFPRTPCTRRSTRPPSNRPSGLSPVRHPDPIVVNLPELDKFAEPACARVPASLNQLRHGIRRRCKDLAGRSAEPFGFTNGREGPADLGQLVGPPPALVVALLMSPKPRSGEVGLAYRPLVCPPRLRGRLRYAGSKPAARPGFWSRPHRSSSGPMRRAGRR